jgi:hypothetical protein
MNLAMLRLSCGPRDPSKGGILGSQECEAVLDREPYHATPSELFELLPKLS